MATDGIFVYHLKEFVKASVTCAIMPWLLDIVAYSSAICHCEVFNRVKLIDSTKY